MNKAVYLLTSVMFCAITTNAQQTDTITQKTRIINGDTVNVETHPDGKSIVTNQTTGQREVYIYVEQMPEPTYNVYNDLVRNVNQTLKFKDTFPVRIAVKFIVTETGAIDSVSLAGTLRHDPILEDEAIRIIKSLPKWRPGKQNGKAVSVWYTLPVTFQKI